MALAGIERPQPHCLMAERRPPGFNVALGFYDCPEVLSIPRKVRAAAVGVWMLCGSYSANQLTDGYVSAAKLKELGCTPTIRAALKATLNADGSPSPLWVDSAADGIQFTRWTKWQRTAVEVKTHRQSEADRKKAERQAKRDAQTGHVDATYGSRGAHVSDTYGSRGADVPPHVDATSAPRNHGGSDYTCGNYETSGRTNAGRSQNVRPEDGDPKAKAKTESSFGYLEESATEGNGRDSIAATPAAELVRRTIPREINDAIQTGLRIAASTLLKSGTHPDVVEEALTEWATRTGVGPGVLASMAADVVKRRNGHSRSQPRGQPHKMRGLAQLTQQERAREETQLHAAPTRKELE